MAAANRSIGNCFNAKASGRTAEAINALVAEKGEAAMRRGEVGAVILAGGMATRFGGVVKAAVEAVIEEVPADFHVPPFFDPQVEHGLETKRIVVADIFGTCHHC